MLNWNADATSSSSSFFALDCKKLGEFTSCSSPMFCPKMPQWLLLDRMQKKTDFKSKADMAEAVLGI